MGSFRQSGNWIRRIYCERNVFGNNLRKFKFRILWKKFENCVNNRKNLEKIGEFRKEIFL